MPTTPRYNSNVMIQDDTGHRDRGLNLNFTKLGKLKTLVQKGINVNFFQAEKMNIEQGLN